MSSWGLVTIGSVTGLAPVGVKPLAEPTGNAVDKIALAAG